MKNTKKKQTNPLALEQTILKVLVVILIALAGILIVRDGVPMLQEAAYPHVEEHEGED